MYTSCIINTLYNIAIHLAYKHIIQVAHLKDVYHFMMPVDGSRGRRSVNNYPDSDHLTECLQAHDNVLIKASVHKLQIFLLQVGYVRQQERKKLYKKEGYDIPTDPNFDDQWSLVRN